MNAERWQALAVAYNQAQMDVRKLSPREKPATVLAAYDAALVPVLAEAALHPTLRAPIAAFTPLAARFRKEAKAATDPIGGLLAVVAYGQAADAFLRSVHALLLRDPADGPTGWPA